MLTLIDNDDDDLTYYLYIVLSINSDGSKELMTALQVYVCGLILVLDRRSRKQALCPSDSSKQDLDARDQVQTIRYDSRNPKPLLKDIVSGSPRPVYNRVH